MNRRAQLWDTLASKYPGSYWGVQSMLFYGISTLTGDVVNAVGWTYTREWPPMLLTAALFGGFMLWIARRRRAVIEPAP